jgi:hypothetical protein
MTDSHFKFPVPETAPDAGSFITVGFNRAWLPFVLGALYPFRDAINWDDPPDDITDQVDELLHLLTVDLDAP